MRIDEAECERAVGLLRALGGVSVATRLAAAAHRVGHSGLASAASQVDTDHARAATAIQAEALSLAEAIETSVAELVGVDRTLARGSAAKSALSARGAADE